MMDAVVEFPSVIELNVGGTFFTTRLSTLTKDSGSMLASMFSGRHRLDTDSQGRFFIDRNGSQFQHVLDYLRHDKLPPKQFAVDVLEEAEYYQVQGLVEWCQQQDSVLSMRLKRAIEEAEVASPLKEIGFLPMLLREAENLLKTTPSCLKTAFVLGPRDLETAFPVQDFHLAIIEGNPSQQPSDRQSLSSQRYSYFVRVVKLSSKCVKKGRVIEHDCQIEHARPSMGPVPPHFRLKPALQSVNLALYGVLQLDHLFAVKKELARFNEYQAPVGLRVHKHFGENGSLTDSACYDRCTECGRQIFYVHLQFVLWRSGEGKTSRDQLLHVMSQQLSQFQFETGKLITRKDSTVS